MFQEFPYTDMHQLNLDWIIKIAKDFLDQYTHIQQLIEDGEESLQNLTTEGLQQLQEKADNLEALLQAWYDTHSQDIANQLADALADLNEWYNTHSQDIAGQLADALEDLNEWYNTHIQDITTALSNAVQSFNTEARNIGQEVIASIPADYSEVAADAENVKRYIDNNIISNVAWTPNTRVVAGGYTTDTDYKTTSKIPVTAGDILYLPFQVFYLLRNSSDAASGFGVSPSNGQLTIPANTATIEMSVANADVNKFCVLKNTSDYISRFFTTYQSKQPFGFVKTDNLYQFHHSGDNSGTLTDCNTAEGNHIYVLGSGLATTGSIANLPADFLALNTGDAFLIDIQYKFRNDPRHWQIINTSNGIVTWSRTLVYNVWSAWKTSILEKEIVHVGSGEEYTKLTDALNYAYSKGNVHIIVHPGTYNIASEIDLETSGRGCYIGKGTILECMAGSSITCYYNGSSASVQQDFSPLNAGDGDFTIIGLNIDCKNVRYCVHDERGASNIPYRHEYINCIMHTDNRTSSWIAFQCIGGGLGKNGTIFIDGGYYESEITTQTNDLGEITYHNNGGSASSESRVFIRNVYCKNSTIKMLPYGTYTDKTKCYINNCSTAAEIVVYNDRPGEYADNMDLIKWNNVIH